MEADNERASESWSKTGLNKSSRNWSTSEAWEGTRTLRTCDATNFYNWKTSLGTLEKFVNPNFLRESSKSKDHIRNVHSLLATTLAGNEPTLSDQSCKWRRNAQEIVGLNYFYVSHEPHKLFQRIIPQFWFTKIMTINQLSCSKVLWPSKDKKFFFLPNEGASLVSESAELLTPTSDLSAE